MFKAETNPLCPHEGNTLWSEIQATASEMSEKFEHLSTSHMDEVQGALQHVRSLSHLICRFAACKDDSIPDAEIQSVSETCDSLRRVLEQSSISPSLKAMGSLTQDLTEKVRDLQLAIEEVMPPMPPVDMVKVETQNMHQKHRLAFQLEHKIENLTKKLEHKTQQSAELQQSNADLRAELSRSLKQTSEHGLELKETQTFLMAVEAAVSEIHGLEEGDKVVLLSTMKAEGATLAKKLNQRLSDIGIVSKRRSLLLEACEKENEDLKSLVSGMKSELQASLRLQAEMQKASSRLPRFSERPERNEAYVMDLEEEVRHWQNETELTRNELSDQLSENAALRKQLNAAEDKQQQLLAQEHEGSQLPIIHLEEKLAAAEAELEQYKRNAVRDEASKVELKEALEELKADLGEEEFDKLEKLVEGEIDDGGFPTAAWVRETMSAGSLMDLNTGRLARKLSAMIKLASRTDEDTEETEAVILEFVDKVRTPPHLKCYDLKHAISLHRQSSANSVPSILSFGHTSAVAFCSVSFSIDKLCFAMDVTLPMTPIPQILALMGLIERSQCLTELRSPGTISPPFFCFLFLFARKRHAPLAGEHFFFKRKPLLPLSTADGMGEPAT